uniref:Uncharacterized protein n=1 Tax=Peromyscus maniculatus bairdii TaxID=230844 RepID=A0A8C9CTZ7_PERMB
MAASPVIPPPVTLSGVRTGFYEDEKNRLWMVVSLGFRPFHPIQNRIAASMTVTLWQVNRTCLQSQIPFSSTLTCLPMTWYRFSATFYRGSDSMFWQLVGHIQVSVWFLTVKAAVAGVSNGK